MKLVIKKSNIWKIIFLFFIFQPCLFLYVPKELEKIVNYSDEIAVILLMVFTAVKLKFTFKLLKFEQVALIFIGIFETLGLVSGFITDFQAIKYVVVDAFICLKFFLVYLCTRLLLTKRKSYDFFKEMNTLCRWIAFIFFALTVNEIFFVPFFPSKDFRYLFYSVQLFFGHPETLARACFPLIIILTYNLSKKKLNIYFIIMLSFVMISTFRAKAIGAIFVYYLMLIYFVVLKRKKKLPFALLGVLGAGYLGYDQINYYYTNKDFARTILTLDSIDLANKYFPLGTGFGTFGSNMAAEHYSEIYVMLGYENIWQMGVGGKFLSDTFWPIIIAQTGWIGVIVFLGVIVTFLFYIFNMASTDKYLFVMALSIFVYDLISSFASSAFFNPCAMAFYCLLGVIISAFENKRQGIINEQ